ncbi:MAG: PD40 domain-containing protein [Gemmatimonadetes bacterium]|nr:PD40 domain-containing protein [Gemmatimonadota bacterium]
MGASWGANDVIVFGTAGGVLMQVAAAGGTPEPIATLDTAIGETSHRWPEFLPGGDAVAFTSWSGTNETARIAIVSLASGRVTHLSEAGTNPHYTIGGHLVYTRSDGSVVGVPFDIGNMAVTGQAIPLIAGVALGGGGVAELAVSRTGSLVYLPGGAASARRTLVMVDRQGVETPLTQDARPYTDPRFSPSGDLVAVQIDGDIWVYDVHQGTLSVRTFEGDNVYPTWSPDGTRLIFSSARPGQARSLYSVPADGSSRAEPFFESQSEVWESALSPDGQWLAIRTGTGSDRDILAVSLEGEDRSPRPFAQTSFDERTLALSPDGRWLAYVSDESGQDEVYVRAFPEPTAQILVSVRGGSEPSWAPSGQELFYRTPNGMMAAAVQTAPVFRVTERELLFEDIYRTVGQLAAPVSQYDVDPRSGRFLMIKTEQAAGEAEIVVVVNWVEELRRRMGRE